MFSGGGTKPGGTKPGGTKPLNITLPGILGTVGLVGSGLGALGLILNSIGIGDRSPRMNLNQVTALPDPEALARYRDLIDPSSRTNLSMLDRFRRALGDALPGVSQQLALNRASGAVYGASSALAQEQYRALEPTVGEKALELYMRQRAENERSALGYLSLANQTGIERTRNNLSFLDLVERMRLGYNQANQETYSSFLDNMASMAMMALIFGK